MTTITKKLPQVVIVGAGFGGLRAAKALAKEPVKVTLVDRKNYHLFQPLLYQVATAGLSADEIAHPIRGILRTQKNLTFIMGEVTSLDLKERKIHIQQRELSYDYLILAVGSETNFFNQHALEEHSFGLKDLQEAQAIRNHILNLFERAVLEDDETIKRAMLTFVIAGGGPTGVEMAGAIAELTRVLIKDYPTLDHDLVQIVLLEALDRILAHLTPQSSEVALKSLAHKGVQVRLETLVEGYDGKQIQLSNNGQLPSHTLVWAAGVQAVGLVQGLAQEKLSQKRVRVLPTLQIPQDERVFLIGDSAYLLGSNGKPLPMVAPVAMQQADLAVKNLLRMIKSEPLLPFHYKDLGSMATIGRNQAVAELFGVRLRGWPAWLVWLFVHLVQLVGFRNRLLVLINWAWQYLFYDRAVRLIESGDCDCSD
jgi:NADH dehydrogenase